MERKLTNAVRVYGIEVGSRCVNAEDIYNMTEQELYDKFVCGHINEIVSLSVETFFFKLNNDMLDTENMYWFTARA